MWIKRKIIDNMVRILLKCNETGGENFWIINGYTYLKKNRTGK